MSNEEFGGAEFMSTRFNILQKRRMIRRSLKPLENYLLDDIEEGTLYKWSSESEFDLEDLSLSLGTGVNRIYSMLSSLHERGIIVKRDTRYKRRFVLGLDPDFFGQILTNHQNELEQKRHLSLVVDNKGNGVDNSRKQVPNGTNEVPNGTNEVPKTKRRSPKQEKKIANCREIIEEKSPIDPYRLDIDVFRVKLGELHSFPEAKSQYEIEEEKSRQLSAFRRMEAKN